MKKKLLIIHNKKNSQIKEQLYYINIGSGFVKNINAQKISLKKFRDNFYIKNKNLLINKLASKVSTAQKFLPNIFELEIFNLRNDKNLDIDLILNILIIGDIIKKYKFTEIELLTDNFNVKEIFERSFKKVKINYNKEKNPKKNLILLKVIKFYLKALLILCYIKCLSFINSRKVLKSDDACLSLRPIFYKKDKENFFNDSKKIKINFLFSDETHLNHSTADILKIINKKTASDIIHIEEFISFVSFFKSLLKSIFWCFKSLKLDLNLKLKNFDASIFYKDYLLSSLVNRCKLNIYEEAFVKFLKKNKIKRFHLYMFEYNFGFFLINLIRKKLKKTKIIGYQHGIFSDQLLWLDVLLKNKNSKSFLPDQINAFNNISLKDYKSKIKIKKIKFFLIKKNNSQISHQFKKIKNNGHFNKILVLPGTHDANQIYQAIQGELLNKKNTNIFFIKFHPKKQIKFNNTNNLKKIESIKNKKFSNLLISPTSTLVYDFLSLKKKFMVFTLDSRQNLISSKLKNKIKSYNFLN
tara:strand:- start:43 stop:1617 length:1575 start_codon:yes stop_codon:yes gene_type:complete